MEATVPFTIGERVHNCAMRILQDANAIIRYDGTYPMTERLRKENALLRRLAEDLARNNETLRRQFAVGSPSIAE